MTSANDNHPSPLAAFLEEHEQSGSAAFYLDRVSSADDEWQRLGEFWLVWHWPERLEFVRSLLNHIEAGNNASHEPRYSKARRGEDPADRAEGNRLWRRLVFFERIVSLCGDIPNMSLKQARHYVVALGPEDALRFASGMEELQDESRGATRDACWLYHAGQSTVAIVWEEFERKAWSQVTSTIQERMAELVAEQLKERGTVMAPKPIPTLWGMSAWLELWGTLQFAKVVPHTADSSLLVEHFDFGSKAKDPKGQLSTYRQRGKDKPVSKADRRVLEALIAAIERRLAEE